MKLKVIAILFLAFMALGIEYWIYSIGMLQKHITFLEFLLLTGRH